MRLRDLKDIEKDDILAALGLQSRPGTFSWILGTVGLIGIGLVAGASLALLFTPKSGRELRRQIGHRFRKEAGNGEPIEAEP